MSRYHPRVPAGGVGENPRKLPTSRSPAVGLALRFTHSVTVIADTLSTSSASPPSTYPAPARRSSAPVEPPTPGADRVAAPVKVPLLAGPVPVSIAGVVPLA